METKSDRMVHPRSKNSRRRVCRVKFEKVRWLLFFTETKTIIKQEVNKTSS